MIVVHFSNYQVSVLLSTTHETNNHIFKNICNIFVTKRTPKCLIRFSEKVVVLL